MSRSDADEQISNIQNQQYRPIVQSNYEYISQDKLKRMYSKDLGGSITNALRYRVSRHLIKKHVLSVEYESLDHERNENEIVLYYEKKKGPKLFLIRNIISWFMFIIIGICIACITTFICVSIKHLCHFKFRTVTEVMKQNENSDLMKPFLVYFGLSVLPTVIASLLVVYVEVVSKGSGVSNIKCYLNGIRIPNVVAHRVLFIKALGMVGTISGGLVSGMEGPMIHVGASMGAMVASWPCYLIRSINFLKFTREDHEKRNFVAAGAASGIAAAFGAPLGGVIFTVEEGFTHWSRCLTWKVFFPAIVASSLTGIFIQYISASVDSPTSVGGYYFKQVEIFNFDLYETPVFILMGFIGGILGSFWIFLNNKIHIFRAKYVKRKNFLKVIEVGFVTLIHVMAIYGTILSGSGCIEAKNEKDNDQNYKLYCSKDNINVNIALWFQSSDEMANSLLNSDFVDLDFPTIGIFSVTYYLLTCITFGVSLPIGSYIPSIVTGAAWGRAMNFGLAYFLPKEAITPPGKYALIGAAAQLGGLIRCTIALVVILIECSGNLSMCFPLTVTILTAKWTGDLFNDGIFDNEIHLYRLPLLPFHPSALLNDILASEVMSFPVNTFQCVEKVGNILDMLVDTSHNGFPVVTKPETRSRGQYISYGTIRGVILRSVLIAILKDKLYLKTSFDEFHPSVFIRSEQEDLTGEDIDLSYEDRNKFVDLRPYMNNSPYVTLHCTTLPRTIRLFSNMGLRHLPIVTHTFEVIGMVTRKDLSRYRSLDYLGKMGMEELRVPT